MTEPQSITDILTQLPETADFVAPFPASTVRQALRELGLPTQAVVLQAGLRVSLAHLTLPKGTRLREVRALTEDLALRLQVASVRVRTGLVAGQVTLEIAHGTVGRADVTVSLGDLYTRVPTPECTLPWALGLKADGAPVFVDLVDAPHVLIGGQTGSGKSSHLHALVLSLALGTTPADCELAFIDPKRVDLFPFRDLPHVQRPVATTFDEARQLVQDLSDEVAFRFTELQRAGVADLAAYNAWAAVTEGEETMSRIVLLVDELSTLLAGPEGAALADELTVLAQVCRAAGLHLVCATQRPSAATMPTQLRSQLTTRIACRVATVTDSRMILDVTGAERLLGAGDTLVKWGGAEPERVQGTYVPEDWRTWLTNAVAFVLDEAVEPTPAESNGAEGHPVPEATGPATSKLAYLPLLALALAGGAWMML